jgi:hypothetical protein
MHDGGNGGEIRLRLMATWLLPRGESVTYLASGETQSATPGPDARINSSADLALPPNAIQLVQVVRRYPPGAWTSPRSAPGSSILTVLEGQVTRGGPGGATFAPGQSWTEDPSASYAVGNESSAPSTIVMTTLISMSP